MKLKFVMATTMLLLAAGSVKSHAAEVCVESVKMADAVEIDESDYRDFVDYAAYQCKELAQFDSRVDSVIAVADTGAALSVCTGQVEVTVSLAAARAVLGAIKMVVRNLPCDDGPKAAAQQATDEVCKVFGLRGIACRY